MPHPSEALQPRSTASAVKTVALEAAPAASDSATPSSLASTVEAMKNDTEAQATSPG